MKYIIIGVALVLSIADARADVTLSCELVQNDQMLCDIFATSPDSLSNVAWSETGGLSTVFTSGGTAIFKCNSSSSSGTVFVDFLVNGEPGAASQFVNCGTGEGDGSFSCPSGIACVRVYSS